MPYMKVKRGEEWCVHKQGADGQPEGEAMGCHETEAEADAQIRAIHENEGPMEPMMQARIPEWRFVDEFRVSSPTAWFRILPIGKFNKFGRLVEITPEICRDMVGNFRLIPPTKLPVNREHMEEHGRVGTIGGVRQQADGLYTYVDWTAAGLRLLNEDAFGYFSPEIIWGPEDYEGKPVKNVLYGLALTNHPYFGEQTAIYTLQDLAADGAAPDKATYPGGTSVNEDTIINGLWGRFTSLFREAPAAPAPTPAPMSGAGGNGAGAAPAGDPAPVPYGARRQEEARIKALEAALAVERARNRRVALMHVLGGEEFSDIVDVLASMENADGADFLADQFAALRLQLDESAFFGEIGSAGGNDGGLSEADRYLLEVERLKKEGKTAAEAHEIVSRNNPGLFKAYRRASARREED